MAECRSSLRDDAVSPYGGPGCSAVLAGSGFLVQHAAMVRYERDVNRIAFTTTEVEVPTDIRKQLGW